jgi:hypothetical protein
VELYAPIAPDPIKAATQYLIISTSVSFRSNPQTTDFRVVAIATANGATVTNHDFDTIPQFHSIP